jgi:hypothetical protein
VPGTTVATNLNEPLDVELDLPLELPFNPTLPVNDLANLADLPFA